MIEHDYVKKKLLIKKSVHGLAAGSVIKIKVNRNGIPIDPKWRRRVKDAKIDHAVELVKDAPAVKKKAKPAIEPKIKKDAFVKKSKKDKSKKED